jgi:hypothetical protein
MAPTRQESPECFRDYVFACQPRVSRTIDTESDLYLLVGDLPPHRDEQSTKSRLAKYIIALIGPIRLISPIEEALDDTSFCDDTNTLPRERRGV